MAHYIERLIHWVTPQHVVNTGKFILNRKKVYILPTRSGIIFAMLLFVMLLGSINYSKSLGFLLTFLLASMAIVSILHTFRNLSNIAVEIGRFDPVYLHQLAQLSIHLHNPSGISRYSIGLQLTNHAPVLVDINPLCELEEKIDVPTIKRGKLHVTQLKVFTQFPLRLFCAWSWINLNASTIVYPAPEKNPPLPNYAGTNQQENTLSISENDDYYGLRHYVLGDSPKHVAWKAVAKERGMLTKQFAMQQSKTLWLEWDETVGLSLEHRLSRLCSWVIEANQNGIQFGLRLPGQSIEPGLSDNHLHNCLKALALYNF